MIKTCRNCGEVRSMASYCHICNSCRYKKYRLNWNKQHKIYQKRIKDNPEVIKRAKIRRDRYYLANKVKERARGKLIKAILRGKIKKGDTCIICGGKENIQSHHPDYSKPLEAIWLCRSCHYKIHSKYDKDACLKSVREALGVV